MSDCCSWSSTQPRSGPESCLDLRWPINITSAQMNFLVTGGAGFIGSHVCERLLHSGHSVWAMDDLNDFYEPELKRRNLREIQALAKPFRFIHGDLTERAALDELLGSVRFDQIIHLAARAGVRPSLEQPALYQRANVEGTVNLLEAARLNGVKKITIASSSSVYGARQRPDLAIHKFDRLISAGKPIPVFGDGSTTRDYTYISDILEGILVC